MRVLLLAVVMALMTALLAVPAFASQPNQSCGDNPSVPGFNSPGFSNAESKYANPDSRGGLSSGNPHVVSQYDVACTKFPH